MNKYFDELVLNRTFKTPGRTITETDIVMFAALSGDYNEFHTNVVSSEKGAFGRRVAHGLLGLSISHGLIFRLGLFDLTGLGFLQVDEWQFKAPIFIGDTIHVRMKVTGLRGSVTKLDRGIVNFLVDVVNQDDVTVQQGIQTIMMKKGGSTS